MPANKYLFPNVSHPWLPGAAFRFCCILGGTFGLLRMALTQSFGPDDIMDPNSPRVENDDVPYARPRVVRTWQQGSLKHPGGQQQ